MGTYHKNITSGIFYALACIFMGMPLLANTPPSIYPDDKTGLSIDGPYIFYKGGKAIVKTIQLDKGNLELVEETYPSRQDIPVLKCVLDSELSFNIDIKEKITIMPSDIPEPSRLFAISDIEGNFNAFSKTLMGNGVIDHSFNWSYGDGHLVLVGDFFDRGLNVTACLWLIYQLENQAEEAGGMVHFVLGNHEEMNLSGDFRYVRNKYMEVAKKMKCDYADLFSDQTELGQWLRSKNMMVKIGKTLYVHGGLSPQMASANINIDRINKICRAHIGKKADILQEKGGNVSMVFAKSGPFWYRGFFNDLTSDVVRRILTQFGATRVVVGHTIVDDISTLQDGMVYAIDVKHSEKVKDAKYNAMLVEDGRYFKVNYRGKREPIDAVRKSADDGSSIIFRAIKEDNLKIVNVLLKEGYKVNDSYSKDKYHLLHYAIQNGNIKTVQFLLERGADPELFQGGKTALMLAIKHRNSEAVILLLTRPIDINLVNHKKQTALFYAARYGDEAIAKLLLDRGARLDAIDQAGLSPFQYAVRKKNIPVAKLLKATEGEQKQK
ncbi:MAG: hypothetical protein ACI8YQ_000095 [Polaribacter sp.]|jgi:hypothetical protein